MAGLRNVGAEQLAAVWMRFDIPTERIAKAVGVSRQAVQQKAKRLGLPSRAFNRPSKKAPDDLFSRMWMAGVRQNDIAQHFGYTGRNGVSQRARKLRLPPRQRCRGYPGGWQPTITLTQFWEEEMARAWRKERGRAA